MPFVIRNNVKTLFLHVPKTGGGTIEDWLRRNAGPLYFYSDGVPSSLRCCPQHFRMSDFREILGDQFFDHAVMVVRDPYHRIASEYRMQSAIAGSSFFARHPTFSHWLNKAIDETKKNPFYLDNHIRPQWHFVGSGVEVHHYEKGLLNVAARLSEIIGITPPRSLPHIHATSRLRINIQLDLADLLLINEFYAGDFELFGYERRSLH